MSNVVNGVGKRVPGEFRAAIRITLACVLLGGCSASSDRFSSFSMGSGYGGETASNAPASRTKMAANAPQPVYDSPAQPGANLVLADANANHSSGYLQVSKIDLPPLEQRAVTSEGTKMADGYGPYNPPPVSDGGYTGPRVYTPYDRPRDVPPPPPAYGPGGGDPPPPVYDPRGAGREPPPPPGFYRRSDNGPPPHAPRPEVGVYEPRRDPPDHPGPAYRDGGRNYPGPYERSADHGTYDRRGEGRTIRVEHGDTLYALARRHGVTVDMIARANGLSSPSVRPGTELIIPSAGPTTFAQAPNGGEPKTFAQAPHGGEPKTKVAACAGDHCHVVKPGETIGSIARTYGVTEQRLAQANNLPNARSLRPGLALAIPLEKQAPRQAVASVTPERRDEGRPPQGVRAPNLSSATPPEKGSKPSTLQDPLPLKPVPESRTAAAQPVLEPSCEAALANPLPRMGNTFRKPVEGRAIAQFGPQRDGTVNEGVTISVPKGTPIKAAENGVVAYVGDELPGFGNLILVRHADEYVTAYAHADTILVKKCDVVKRGQAIATAGATGDVSQPQLHFEIRKNSKPVDPMPLLGS